jgi:phenylpropionate dioxygenase-like ring-hydroxylating dioxygenase large terminal subunit
MSSVSQEAIAAGTSQFTAEATAWPPNCETVPHGVGVGRYIDPAFARLEFEKLWYRVWQIAARVDEIPETGDYTTYEIGDQSVLLVRVDESTVKAYQNVCPHRGTTLGEGCGHFDGGRIICPFHGWRWDLAGKIQFVLERQEFRNGHLRDIDVALKEVHVVVFAGFVFINLARKPEPFDEFIAPVRRWIDGLAIGDMHHSWWKSIRAPANWKVMQEAFFEAYHVPATHPQLEKVGRDVIYGKRTDGPMMHRNVTYDGLPHGHGRFYGGKKTPMAGHILVPTSDPVEDMAARLSLLVDGMNSMVVQEDVDVVRSLRGKPIPPGSTLGAEYVQALYANAAAQQRPMPERTSETIDMWGGEIFIFPNFMILPQAGNANFYRARPHPTDPDQSLFEIFAVKTYPAAIKPPRATVEHVTDPEQQLRLIPRQDLGNLPRVQKGLHSRAIRHVWLADHQERIISNMHQELDRYLRS